MKYKDLKSILNNLGYVLIRNSKHQIYSNGTVKVAIPHQKQINKMLSKHILKAIGYKE